MLTINDLVSELVGDLRDEFDRSSLPAIERVDKSRFLVDGSCGVDEVRSELGIPIPDGDYVTLGGFLLDGFGRIPEEGDELEFAGWSSGSRDGPPEGRQGRGAGAATALTRRQLISLPLETQADGPDRSSSAATMRPTAVPRARVHADGK